MNSYSTSLGDRVTKKIIDRNIRYAKQQKQREFKNEHGYIFCEDCGKNKNAAGIIDPSHTISVKYAQETGRTELAWEVKNIPYRCRSCHDIHDAKTNLEREEIYNNG